MNCRSLVKNWKFLLMKHLIGAILFAARLYHNYCLLIKDNLKVDGSLSPFDFEEIVENVHKLCQM